jgi:hypothetical protein
MNDAVALGMLTDLRIQSRYAEGWQGAHHITFKTVVFGKIQLIIGFFLVRVSVTLSSRQTPLKLNMMGNGSVWPSTF